MNKQTKEILNNHQIAIREIGEEIKKIKEYLTKQEPKEKISFLTIEEEINKYPERFESFVGDEWVQFSPIGKRNYKVVEIRWLYHGMKKVFLINKNLVEVLNEIIRRKKE